MRRESFHEGIQTHGKLVKARSVLLLVILSGMFAATSAVCSQISFPIPFISVVPINFVHLSVFCAAGILGCRYGVLSQTAFVLAGTLGLPIFSGGGGGIAKLLGPTGGFIAAYIVSAFIVGLAVDLFGRKLKILIPAMVFAVAMTYLMGTLWYMSVMQASFGEAAAACMLPFLPGDAIKVALSSAIVRVLEPVTHRYLWENSRLS